MRTKFLLLVLLGIVFVSALFVFHYINNEINETVQEKTVGIVRFLPEYEENYLSFSTDNKGNLMALETLTERESEIFIERIQEKDIDPKNMLKAGNDVFFAAKIKNPQDESEMSIFLYDSIARKILTLYTSYISSEREMSLVAIDVVNNELIVSKSEQGEICKSWWLSVPDDLYSLGLDDLSDPQLQNYQIPKWKIEEELLKYPECRPVNNYK